MYRVAGAWFFVPLRVFHAVVCGFRVDCVSVSYMADHLGEAHPTAKHGQVRRLSGKGPHL